MYDGVFGTFYSHGIKAVPCSIKINRCTTVARDRNEVLVQTEAYCALRQIVVAPTDVTFARIPKPLFTAKLRDGRRLLGMSTLDTTLSEYLRSATDSPRTNKRMIRILVSVSATIQFLQDTLQFMHFDLTHENIMLRNNQVYIIDFGASAANVMYGVEPSSYRVIVDKETPTFVNPYLDLLTLATTLEETLRETHPLCHETVLGLVGPFWKNVQRRLEGRSDDLYRADEVVRRVKNTLFERQQTFGEMTHRHHMLVGPWAKMVDYPRTAPKAMMRYLSAFLQ